MGKPAPKRKGRRTARRSSAAPTPSLTPVFRDLLRSARALLELEDPLEAELWASWVVSLWHGRELIGDDPYRLFGGGLIRFAARSNRPEGLALLRALAAVLPPKQARQARAAAAPLAAHVAEPVWAYAVGRAELVEAYRVTHPLGGQDALLAAFRHPGRPVHVFCILVDHDVLGGAVKDASVVDSLEEALGPWRTPADFSVLPIEPAQLAGRVLEGIEIADRCVDPPVTEEFEHTRSLLLARMRALPSGWRPEADGDEQRLPEAARDPLVEEFLASPEAAAQVARGREGAGEVAEILIDFRCDYGDGEPLRWNGVLVEVFLCDWYPQKVLREESVAERVPDVLRAWIRYGARRRGLADHLLGDPLTAVDEFEDEFRKAVSDPARFGPAKAIVLAMQADGVDLTDQGEVDGWIHEFNARPLAERQLVLP